MLAFMEWIRILTLLKNFGALELLGCAPYWWWKMMIIDTADDEGMHIWRLTTGRCLPLNTTLSDLLRRLLTFLVCCKKNTFSSRYMESLSWASLLLFEVEHGRGHLCLVLDLCWLFAFWPHRFMACYAWAFVDTWDLGIGFLSRSLTLGSYCACTRRLVKL